MGLKVLNTAALPEDLSSIPVLTWQLITILTPVPRDQHPLLVFSLTRYTHDAQTYVCPGLVSAVFFFLVV